MANTIRIKRRATGVGAGAPSGLANAELAYNEGDNILYYGFGTGGVGGSATQVIPIGGSGAYLNKNNNLSDLNNLQTSRNNLASNTVTSGSFMRGNGTNVLMGSIIVSDIPTLNQNTTGSAGSVTSSLTINNGGAGDNSGSTFNGSSAKTISYNSIGSPSTGGANATGTWNISVTGNAGTVTNGVYTSRTLTAGSGIAGGGDLSADRTFNVGQGDGITVGADAIAVDTTVVRTTGTQSINGIKTFGDETTFTSGMIVSNQTANNLASFDANKKLASSYSIETTLTGGASAIPRADAVKTYVDSAITSGFSTNDAMVFKGTVGSGGTVAALPSGTVSAGWSYRVITSGTYAGVVSEIGDLIIAVADASGNVNNTWTVVQTNIDGAVVGPASSTTNALAVFNGTTGKLIQNSSFVPTTVGGNFINLTNPSAIRFVRINADNTVSSLSDTDFRTAIGAGTSSTVGTVTSVAALTLATSGTDLSSSVANGTTTPTITLSVPTASASVRGALSSGDWTTFNNKAAANQTMFIGTTSVAINRSSATLVLTGITSIDGNAATVTNGVYTTGDQTIAGVKTLSNRPVLNSGLTVQASAAGSSGTYFPVFTADPGTSAQTLTTRTASNLKTDLSLNNVENTALSTWAGSTSITTLGTVATGTWSATTIAATKGGTGQSSYAIGDLLYADTTTSLAKLADVATGNVLLAGGVTTAPSWGKVGLTTHVSGTLPVANGGTAQTSYTDGQLLIGNTTGNTLTKATLTQGTNVTITNGNGTITIASTDTNTATAADNILDGSNTGTEITYAPYATNQAASATPRFYNTSDNPSGSGRLNVSAYFYATRLFDNGSRVVTASTICADAGNCTWDGGDF